MATRLVRSADLESLVHHMFDQVLEESERAELLLWIRQWEAENPDVDAAHRITGWIDVAYAFQARSAVHREVRSHVRGAPISFSGWGPITALG